MVLKQLIHHHVEQRSKPSSLGTTSPCRISPSPVRPSRPLLRHHHKKDSHLSSRWLLGSRRRLQPADRRPSTACQLLPETPTRSPRRHIRPPTNQRRTSTDNREPTVTC
ncbi:hypothetical protein IEO21_10680 [Rhodonia placenta]|uniref:Uncharacterized protein n=1 Tax=Rhodonia placenta TaxID=104341 RepID=A0A8H7NS14_9APHY|nr:hypothetical protein IEO21_10680 [Postia placenta]